MEEYNVSSMDKFLVYVTEISPSFIYLFLLSIYVIVTLSTYFGTKRYGMGDLAACSSVGSVVTFVVAVYMSFKEGLINPFILSVIMVFMVLSVLFFYFSKREL